MRRVMTREAVREAILDAADRRLARFGYRKMTIDDLAAETGIGKGTVYLHFSSKEEVVLSHVDRIVDRLCARLDRLAAQDKPAAERIRAMLVDRVVFRLESVQHYSASLNDVASQIRPGLIERRARHFEKEARIIARVLTEGRRTGELTVPRVPETAQALLEATNALLPYSLSPRELGDSAHVRRRAAAIAALLARALRARP